MKPKELSREELAASMGIDLSHLTEEEIEVFYYNLSKFEKKYFLKFFTLLKLLDHHVSHNESQPNWHWKRREAQVPHTTVSVS